MNYFFKKNTYLEEMSNHGLPQLYYFIIRRSQGIGVPDGCILEYYYNIFLPIVTFPKHGAKEYQFK